MCGIGGIVAARNNEPALRAAERMSAAMSHRGPDDAGLEVLTAGQDPSVVLVFRRLSIIDLSAAGHQPMLDRQSGNWLVYNGEVYNFRELRAELERAGRRFDSNGDAEVILKGYAEWGVEVLKHLRGMFALAIYDASRRRIVLARDRLGIKPLYYRVQPAAGMALIFASEVRALLASDQIERRLSAAGLSLYLQNGYVPDPLTIIDGVASLLPGWSLTVDLDGHVLDHGPFWERAPLSPQRGAANRGDAVARIRSVLEETVQQHMVSDVPLGAFLSGGVDSSALVALMARVSARPLQTFSLVFDDAELSEERYSRLVAERLQTEHHEVRVTEGEFLGLLDDALAALDQPTNDGINSYVVSRKCRESGLTVAIAGTGGDELFGGYTSFHRVPRALTALRRYGRLPGWSRKPLERLARRLLVGSNGHLPSAGLRGKMAALLDLPADPLAVFQLSRWVLLPEMCRRLLREPSTEHGHWGLPDPLIKSIRSATSRLTDLREMVSVFEQTCYLSNQLLRDTDMVSMASSLEVRVPLLDHVLVETVADIHADLRFAGPRPKQLLIDAVRDLLPPEAFERRKQGFVLPYGRWLSGPLASRVGKLFHDGENIAGLGLNPDVVRAVWEDYQAAKGPIFYNRVWGLFVLADWCQRHGVQAA